MARALVAVMLLSCAALLAVGWLALRGGRAGGAAEAPSPSAPVAPVEARAGEMSPLEAPQEQVAAPETPRADELERELVGFDAARVPNLRRVAGLSGPLVRGSWPNGTAQFEAHQRQQPGGGWTLHGPWQAWHANGELEELGAYSGGREDGDWQWWYENGMPMAEGRFEDGARVGRWSFWHDNGERLAEGDYVAGRRTGPWTFWYADGRVHSSGAAD